MRNVPEASDAATGGVVDDNLTATVRLKKELMTIADVGILGYSLAAVHLNNCASILFG